MIVAALRRVMAHTVPKMKAAKIATFHYLLNKICSFVPSFVRLFFQFLRALQASAQQLRSARWLGPWPAVERYKGSEVRWLEGSKVPRFEGSKLEGSKARKLESSKARRPWT